MRQKYVICEAVGGMITSISTALCKSSEYLEFRILQTVQNPELNKNLKTEEFSAGFYSSLLPRFSNELFSKTTQ